MSGGNIGVGEGSGDHVEGKGGKSKRRGIAKRPRAANRDIIVSRTAVAGLSVLLVVLAGWIVYSSYVLIRLNFGAEFTSEKGSQESSSIDEVRLAHERLTNQVRTYQRQFAEVSSQLAESRRHLAELTEQNSRLKEELLLATDRVDSVDETVARRTADLEAEIKDNKSKILAVTAALRERNQAVARLTVENKGLRNDLASAKERLAAAATVSASLKTTERRISELSEELRVSRITLDKLRDENAVLNNNLSVARDRLSDVAQEDAAFAELLEKNAILREELASARDRLVLLKNTEARLAAVLDERRRLQADLSTARDTLQSVERAREKETARAERLIEQVRSLESELNEHSGQAFALKSNQDASRADVAVSSHENSGVVGERDRLRGRIEKLERRIAAMQRSQQDFLLHVAERTIDTIDEAERTIAMTGLGVEWLLDRVGNIPVGLGGPFVAVNADLLAATELRHEVSVLDSHMDRWERLQYILRMLPLSAPIDHYRVTSGFGKRRDPINGRWAMHYGFDLAAPLRSPVLSTSAGTVVFAGWNASYGRTVEIDHGMGISTRYGHLRSIHVEKGDKVAFREEIGELGSSGRSTGPHVHYEILVDGKPVDPETFLRAGKYAFKG
jgi:murein DD-endopeptidase MepM/ murein hydrolase activator NlpD